MTIHGALQTQPQDVPESSTPFLLRQALNMLYQEIGADAVCVCQYSHEVKHLHPVLDIGLNRSPSLQAIIESHILYFDSPYVLTTDALKGTGYSGGLMWHLTSSGDIIGLVVALTVDGAKRLISESDVLQQWLEVCRLVLENQLLRENDVITHTIRDVAANIGDDMTPQDMVNILSARLFRPPIRFCALLQFGPVREDRPYGPFAYLEVMGSWSRQFGPGIGAGIRLYVDQYTEILGEISRRRVWPIPDIRAIEKLIDPLTRAFIRGANVRSAALISLGAGGHDLGVLLVGSDEDYQFTPQELRVYLSVSEFLAMTAMTRLLQQQRDFVRRARGAILDAVTDGVVMVLPNASRSVPNDNANTYVLMVNQCFTTMFNIPQSKAEGLSLTQLLNKMQLPDDLRQELISHWISTPLRDPSTPRGEFTMVHPHGKPVTIEWYSAPVYQDSRVMGRIFTFHDVTADRMAISLRASFISRMSHELRTPLTSIKGFAQMILEEMGAEMPPLAYEYTQIILDNARQLTALFTNIIEITRADTGEMKLNIAQAWLKDLIESTAYHFESAATDERKWLRLEISEHLPQVQMDSNRIGLVLHELLSNAFRHAPENSEIKIQAIYVDSSSKIPHGAPEDVVIPAVLVSVTDEGSGFSTEEAEQIFLPFYRTQEARSARMPGMGLGLTNARSIIEIHRGKLWAEPRRPRKRGARFFFTLPTAELS